MRLWFACDIWRYKMRFEWLIETAFAGKGSDHLQLIKFWPSRAPGKGVSGGTIFLAPPYYSQRAVFASPPSAFLLSVWFCSIHECTPSVYILLREGASPLAISCFGVYDSAVHSTSFFLGIHPWFHWQWLRAAYAFSIKIIGCGPE